MKYGWLYLAANLKGQFKGILNDLDCNRRRIYRDLTHSLNQRLGPGIQTNLLLAGLKNRSWQTIESLSSRLKTTDNSAYPEAPYGMIETLNSKCSGGHLHKMESLAVKNSQFVVVRAVEIEAFHVAETKKGHLRSWIMRGGIILFKRVGEGG